jgi:hypothetical protein
MKEIANKMIVYNIHTFLQFLIAEVFYRAKNRIHGTVSARRTLEILLLIIPVLPTDMPPGFAPVLWDSAVVHLFRNQRSSRNREQSLHGPSGS